jgi:hypothetical protein
MPAGPDRQGEVAKDLISSTRYLHLCGSPDLHTFGEHGSDGTENLAAKRPLPGLAEKEPCAIDFSLTSTAFVWMVILDCCSRLVMVALATCHVHSFAAVSDGMVVCSALIKRRRHGALGRHIVSFILCTSVVAGGTQAQKREPYATAGKRLGRWDVCTAQKRLSCFAFAR